MYNIHRQHNGISVVRDQKWPLFHIITKLESTAFVKAKQLCITYVDNNSEFVYYLVCVYREEMVLMDRRDHLELMVQS